MADIDLDELEKLAKAAVNGPWRWDGLTLRTATGYAVLALAHGGCCADDTSLVAAMSPDVVLALIAMARRTEEAVERAERALRIGERAAEAGGSLLAGRDGIAAENRTLRRHRDLAERDADRFAGLADVMHQVLERAGARAAELERQLTAATRAIAATLDRIQGDPDVRYLLGPGSDVFRRLVEAEAAITGDDVDAVDATRVVARPPVSEPEVVRLRRMVQELEDSEPHGDDDCAQELPRLRGAIERAIECAETVTFETATRNDFKTPMVPAQDLRDILDGRQS